MSRPVAARYTDRVSSGTKAWVFAIWVAGAVLWVLPAFFWQLDYYKTPGPLFYKAIVVAAPLAAAASLLYARLRRRPGVRRFEPWIPAVLAAPILLRHPWPSIAALLITLSCYVMGRRALQLSRIRLEPSVENAALSFAGGLALASCALFWIGLAGLFQPWLFATLAIAPCALGRRSLAELWAVGRACIRAWRDTPDLANPLVGVGVFFLGLCGLSAVAVMLAPAIAFDAVNYHLPLAKSYAILGALVGLPNEPHSIYPQGFEVLLSWAYGIGGIEAGRILAVLLFLLALLVCWSVGRRLGLSRAATALGVAVAATMPAVHFTGVTVKNDLLLAVYQFGCLLCYFRWSEEGETRWLGWGALLAASSFGLKHTAVFPGLALAALGLHALWVTRASRWKLVAAAAALGMLGAGVWHIRAIAITGNPTFPLSARRMANASIQHVSGADSTSPAVKLLASVPRTFVDLHRRGSLVFESILPAPVGAFLVLFLPAPFLVRTRLRRRLPTVLFVLGSFVVWAAVMALLRESMRADMTLRYVLPAFLLWPMLLTAPALALLESFSRPFRALVLIATSFSFVVGWSGLLIIENSGDQLRYIAGRMSEADYLAGALLPYRAVAATAAVSKPGEMALAFEGCASLYYAEPWEFRCYRTRNWKDPAAVVRAQPGLDEARFLILRTFAESAIADLSIRAERIYGDKDFVAYRLLQPPDAGR
jgi:hypothetical protein